MARLKDVADRAGVSTATTSRVLTGKGYVSDELRHRVLLAVEELNYSPDGVARSMSQRRTHTIGLVVSDVTNPFFTAVARGVEDIGQQRGYSLVLCNTDENLAKERAYLAVLREKRVDGILLAVSSQEAAHIRPLLDAGTKLVLIDRAIPGFDVPSVTVDNIGGIFQATDYLLGLGHRRIGIITVGIAVSTAVERLDGYKAALARAGMSRDPELIVHGGFTQQDGYESGLRLWSLSKRPTAVISCNNVMTTGLLIALRERGARIPEDVSVIGFDDLPYFALLENPLTAVAQPMYELGRCACELLLRLISGDASLTSEETHLRLPTQLLIRSSCRRVEVCDVQGVELIRDAIV